ncbi:hypothetical protein OH708_19750 [Pseudomonas capsici]|uniref:hypothetical protein n=1 Tax=Pseudomonas capsici TaxID=2810614 RepID=UPI0021F1DA02|nr:hypothetical protein [Pseudomonas capsici]MCV4263748.1 hypothetical protein [Pseudomonas capsici]MCV4290149.1 hypothetical protein [Pseudomonas capsici]
MTIRVIYQPCSEKVARKNLQTTILNPVLLEEIGPLLDPGLLQVLHAEHPTGKVYIWGLSPSQTEKPWAAMQPGDLVLFNTQGVVTVTAQFSHRTHNRDLALRLWGYKDEAQNTTWENIYFVTHIRHIAIPFPEIQAVVKNQQRMAFFRYDAIDSQAILDQFIELTIGTNTPPVTLNEARREIDEDMETEGSASQSTRKEHRYIVDHLFGKKLTGTCCICQGEYPRKLLVAAHIKKRAACEKKEKLDIEHIAAPMCKMGCDPLFEHGYISVRDGIVVKHPSMEMTSAIEHYIDQLVDKKTPIWNGKNSKYFKWHRETHGFEPLQLSEAMLNTADSIELTT